MSRLLLWVTAAGVGLAAVFLSSFVGLAVFPLLTVAVIVIARTDRRIAVSGLMIGFGSGWLLGLLGRATSPTFEDTIPVAWLLVAVVPLVIGAVLLAPMALRSLRGRSLVRH